MRHTTLIFLRREDQILLAMKKVRFGAGKWNGPGGKVEDGETYEQAAVRECQEEISVTPQNLKKAGEMHFFDIPDVEHYCHIYQTIEWEGKPTESEEMRPQWFNITEIPYADMWPDDKFWLPMMLEGKLFKGKVVVENNILLTSDFQEVSSL